MKTTTMTLWRRCKVKYRAEIPWKVKYTADDDDSTSGKELAEKGYTLPEYHFAVHYGRAESVQSGVMKVQDELLVYLDNFSKVQGKTLIVFLPNNTKQELLIDSPKMVIKDVVIGLAKIAVI